MPSRTCVQISPADIRHASRITKTCRSLAASGMFDRVVFIGASSSNPTDGFVDHPGGFQYMHLPRPIGKEASFLDKVLWTRRFKAQLLDLVPKLSPSVIGCRTLPTLPACLQLKRKTGAKLMYDIHELETETMHSRGLRRVMMKQLEAGGIRKVDGVIVVGNRIADWYRDAYGIPRPTVVMAVPDTRWQMQDESSRRLREKFGIGDDQILFLYQGNLTVPRRAAQLVEAFKQVQPDRHIVFMGGGPVEGLIQEAGKTHANIHHLPPVPPEEVLAYTASADIGILGMAGGCLNHEFSMGNKGFEYLFAGIPQIAAPLAEMKDFVLGNGIGWIYGDATSEIVEIVNRLTRQEISDKRAAVREARAKFSWAQEEAKLVEAYKRLL